MKKKKKALQDLVKRLGGCKDQMDPEAIQTIVYSVGKDNGYKENLREWFRVIYEIIFGDGRISSKFLHPGPGFGGSCFPKDIEALYALGKEKNIELNTIDATIKTNKNQKKRILNKLLRLLNKIGRASCRERV